MIRICVEGVDGVGKSHFCREFIRNNNSYVLVRPQLMFERCGEDYSKVWEEIENNSDLNVQSNVIYDRSPISEYIYSDKYKSFDDFERKYAKFIFLTDIFIFIESDYYKYKSYVSLKCVKDKFDCLSESEFGRFKYRYDEFKDREIFKKKIVVYSCWS